MTEKKKLGMLEEMMELEPDTLSADVVLEELGEYDSLARLSLMVLMEDEFGLKLTGDEIRAFRTVGDILARMEAE